MKKLVGLMAIAFVGLNAGLSAQAITTGYDIVCGYKYRVGSGNWTRGHVGATTRHAARKDRATALSQLESQAAASGQSFESQHLGCRDLYGHN
ncbi:MAG: hypothetical protein SWJ54_10415 [Cyanobacteriota bacterium]|nr:hypothetical protein [Cyanobacteriota bacterium]